MPRLGTDDARAAPLPFPPLPEQHRIVAKVDELMALCDRLEARQQDAEAAHARLVQALLDSLTQARDAQEFQANWERLAGQFEAVFTTLESVEELKKTLRVLAFTGRLSNGVTKWERPRVGDVVDFLNGYAFKSEWFMPDGVRLVRNANIGHGRIEWGDVACLSPEMAGDFSGFALSLGDLLLSLDRPRISSGLKVALVREVDLPCLLLQRVAKLTPKKGMICVDYLLHWLCSPLFMDVINPGRSNGVPHISTKQVASLLIPLPPINEQRRIVAKLESFFSLCDRLKSRITATRAKHAQLAEVLVKQAVDG